MKPSTDRTSTLPSSRSYADWAASRPEVYLDFGGKIGMARAKCCAFCGVPTRLSPQGDQPLIEHMKSNACKNIQRQLKDEITGQNALVHNDASQAIESMPTGKCGVCYICGRVVPIKQCMRIHVAKHILARWYQMKDPLLDDGSMVVGYAPCGFCGRSGAPECRATLTITKRSTTFKSGCPFYDNFLHKAAGKPTVIGPCTNRPLRCEYFDCSQKDPIWSYHMREHILARHGQSAHARAINEGQYLVSEEEIKLLQLDNMFIIPGRRRIVLHDTPNRGAKRPLEASTANIISGSQISFSNA